MSIAFVGAGALSQGTTASLAPALPGGLSPGDRIVAIAGARGATAKTWTFPGGWTEHLKYQHQGSPGAGTLVVASKQAGGSESAPSISINDPSFAWSVALAAYSGVDSATPMDVTPAAGENASSLTWSASPSLSPVTAGAMVVACVLSSDDNGLILSIAEQFVLRMGSTAYRCTTGTHHSLGMASRLAASPGEVTMPTWEQEALGPDSWVGITIALRPGDVTPPASALSKLIDMDTRRIVRVVT